MSEPRPAAEVRSQGRLKRVAPLSAHALDLVAARFRMLGEPLRVRLIQALRDGERSVSDLVEALEATQPNVSKHLRLLQQAGIVGRRHQGNLVFYFVDDPSVFELCDAVCAAAGDELHRLA